MDNTIRILAEKVAWTDSISLLVRRRNSDGVGLNAIPLTFEEKHSEMGYIEPTVNISIDAAQNLMDQLWACGLRPTEGSGSAGSLAATQTHLKDMQKIAFDLLERTKNA